MMLWPIVSLVMNFAVISVLWFGGIMVNRGLIQVGIIMAFINYIIQIMNDLIMAVGIVINISRAKASADRINEIFDIVPAINNNDGTIKPEKYDVEFKKSFKSNLQGEEIEMAFNPKYIVDALKNYKGQAILKIVDEISPMLITDGDKKKDLVLPIRLMR